ncbi:MAG: Lrp/AsnC family transcriptional regulator [Candidatus Heimdallarchaeota archaeon]|nr:Lrp/AsnC family transcriptional regulator [Candidatus Heimdallarchaeota archaeon]
MKFTLDDKDLEILKMLSKDGKIAYNKIAEELNVTSQTISDRIERMKKRGIISRFTLTLRAEEIGYPIEFICELDINATVMDKVLKVLRTITEIHIIRITTGIHDILCFGNAASIENLHDIVERKISTIPGVNKTYTSITLKKVKDSQVLNLDE